MFTLAFDTTTNFCSVALFQDNILTDKFSQDTRQYAKRQITWFTKQPNINIINIDENMTITDIINKII